MYTLFVVSHAARFVANSRLKGLLWDWLGRAGLRKLVVERTDSSFRRILDAIERSLTDWIIFDF